MAKEKKNKLQLFIQKHNPWSKSNKNIRGKEQTIKSKDSTTKEKSVAKVQKAALKRKRDGVKIADLQAKRKQEMRDRARKRHEAFKAKKKNKKK